MRRLLLVLALVLPELASAQAVIRGPLPAIRRPGPAIGRPGDAGSPVAVLSFSSRGCSNSGTVFGLPGVALNNVRSGPAIYEDPDGTEHACTDNQLRIDGFGLVSESQRTNVVPSSDNPTFPQTAAVTTGQFYSCWVKCAGNQSCYATISNSTAVIAASNGYTQGLPCTADRLGCRFQVTTGGNITVGAGGGTVSFVQCENGGDRTTPIHTSGSPATRNADQITFSTPAALRTSFCAYTTWGGGLGGLGYTGTGAGNHGWLNIGGLGTANSTGFWAQNTTTDTLGWAAQVASTSVAAAGQLAQLGPKQIDLCAKQGAVSFYLNGAVAGSLTQAISAQPATTYLGQLAVASPSSGSNVRIHRLTLTNKATWSAQPTWGRRICMVGDSIAHSGAGALTNGLAQLGTLNDQAVSGYTASQILARWETIRGTGCTDLIVQGGINDIRPGGTAAATWTTMKQIIDEALADGLEVYGINLTPSCVGAGGACETERESYNATLAAYAPSSHYHAVDVDSLVNDGANAFSTTACFGSTCNGGDAVHPSTMGYVVIWRDRVAILIIVNSPPLNW